MTPRNQPTAIVVDFYCSKSALEGLMYWFFHGAQPHEFEKERLYSMIYGVDCR